MMGRYLRKSKGVGEVPAIEMAEIGVRMTTKTRDVTEVVAESVVVKRRKISDEDLAPAPLQPENSCRNPVMPEKCASQERYPVSSLDIDDEAQASCCSSYDESVAREKSEFADLEEEETQESTGEVEAASTWNSECAESGKTTPLREHETESDELGSNGTPPPPPPPPPPGDQLNSRVNEVRENMPSDAELEDFFTAAEQKFQKRFEEKYNFDIVNDKPLEGRYEWVQSMQPFWKHEEDSSSSSPAVPKKV